jgi:FkbM family methyltransferase
VREEKKVYSQHDEEIIIRDFFQDRREGVFLDVGCARPKQDSNTFFLEDELGWSGIGVDALAEFKQPWKKRRRSRFFHFAVTDRAGDTIPFYRARGGLEGISSITPRKTFSRKKVEYDVILVPTITLTKLLDDNGISRLDFLSVDIEGAEPLALAGFDIDRFRPELACVETRAETREAIRAYFAAHGYEQIARYVPFDVVNDYFTPRAKGR